MVEPDERVDVPGADRLLRGPFGNPPRIGTPREGAIEIPDPDRIAVENWS